MRNNVKLLAIVFLLSGLGGSATAASSIENISANGAASINSAYSSVSLNTASLREQNAAAQKDFLKQVESVKATQKYTATPAYLRGTETLTGEALFQKLHDATNTTRISAYNSAKSYMYSTADHVTMHGTGGVVDAYSQVFLPGTGGNGGNYGEQGDQNEDGVVDKGVNAEHTWPQSFFREALPMKADLHHLQTTLITPNGRRGSLPYAEVSNATYTTSGGSKLGKEGFEPCDANKGNTARAMLYFMVRYYDKNIRQGGFTADKFWKSRVEMFMKWNRQDPPDDAERTRNDLVEQYQGNRNPFIDNPGLVDQIGAATLKAH